MGLTAFFDKAETGTGIIFIGSIATNFLNFLIVVSLYL